jgi:hypothetical protein
MLIVTQIVKTIPIQIAIIVNRNCFCVMSKYRKINNNKGIAIQEPFAPTIKLALSADSADSASNTLSGTASERFIFWKVAIDTAKKHPFFGSGSGDFRLELERFTTAYPPVACYPSIC